MGDAKGGFSGGTLASAYNLIENTPMAELNKMSQQGAYYLTPPGFK